MGSDDTKHSSYTVVKLFAGIILRIYSYYIIIRSSRSNVYLARELEENTGIIVDYVYKMLNLIFFEGGIG